MVMFVHGAVFFRQFLPLLPPRLLVFASFAVWFGPKEWNQPPPPT